MKQSPDYDLFKGVDKALVNQARSNMIYWVLGTDNAYHKAHCEEFEAEIIKEGFTPEG